METGASVFDSYVRKLHARELQKQRNAAQVIQFMREQEFARAKEERTRQFERNKYIFDAYVKVMDNATPAEKELYSERLSGTLGRLIKSDPQMGQALFAMYPKQFRKMRSASFMKEYPPPREWPSETKPADNYSAYAQNVVNKEKYRRLHAKQVDNLDVDIKGFHQIDDKMGLVISDNQGAYQLFDMQLLNSPKLKELLDKKNLSLLELQARGGDYGDSTVKLTGVAADGSSWETLYQTTKNAFTGRIKLEALATNKQKDDRITHGEPPEPDLPIRSFIAHLAADDDDFGDGDMANSMKALFKDIKGMGREYYKLYDQQKSQEDKEKIKRAFSLQLERKLQTLSPEHVFVIQPGLTGEKVGIKGFFNRFAIGNQATIKPIYGKREYVTTKDGKPFGLILDRANNLAYFPNGQLVPGATVEKAISMAASMTMTEWQAYAKRIK